MRIGVDMGGTKIEAVLLDGRGEERIRRRVATPGGYDETLAAVVDLVRALEREADVRASVGLGIPGTISPATGLVKNANSTWLIGERLDADLAERLDRPVRVSNDANCFALSEAADGAAAGASSVFGVIIGTGVGGGIVLGGRVLEGATRIAGEWGHNPLPHPEIEGGAPRECWCGRLDCVETYCSGPGLAKDHQERTGEALSAREVAAKAAAGDGAAAETLERYVARLARALGTVVNVLDPEVVVLGGGVSNVEGLAERLQARLPRHVFSDEVRARVVKNVHGDSSGVRGAAWLWAEGEGLPG